MKRLFIINLIILTALFLCGFILASAQSASEAPKAAAKIQSKDMDIKHPAQGNVSEHPEGSHLEGSHPEGSHAKGSGAKHSHAGEGGPHISGEHEKFELFHAEYYSMPWRSLRTQKDLWVLMGFWTVVNILLLLLINVKMKRKYK